MKFLAPFLQLSRWLVGILFIFSGLVKANDPRGLAYKMQEFFEIWAGEGFLPGLMQGLQEYALAFSIIMISFEIVAGVAVLLAWRMRLISWLLLLLILFFTLLTGYAYLSGKFKSCGCFGDCIPITPFVSFLKDLVLLALILVIFGNRNRFATARKNISSNLIVSFSLIASLVLQWYVLRHLPLIDCLPYKIGNNLTEKMKIPPGAIPDSTVISFVYRKQGREIEFTADQFPEDFDDSTYQFVKRYDKLVRKGNAEPPIKDFSLKTLAGNDTTQALLDHPGRSILLFAGSLSANNPSWKKDLLLIVALAAQKQWPLYCATSDAESAILFLNNELSGFQVLHCDAVAVKTAARANPTLYLLEKGRVLNKWGYADFDDAPPYLSGK